MCVVLSVSCARPLEVCRAPSLHALRAATWLTVYRAPQVIRRVFISMSNSAADAFASIWCLQLYGLDLVFPQCWQFHCSFGMGLRFPDTLWKKLQDCARARLMSKSSRTAICCFPKGSDILHVSQYFVYFSKFIQIQTFNDSGNALSGWPSKMR